MSRFDGLSIKIRNYKCFGDEPQGFDKIMPINVIVGKNNSGKSSLIEMIEFALGGFPEDVAASGHRDMTPELALAAPVTEWEAAKFFPSNEYYQLQDGSQTTARAKAEACIGQPIRWRDQATAIGGKSSAKGTAAVQPPDDFDFMRGYWQSLVVGKTTALRECVFRKLQAARDVKPEDPGTTLDGIGEGSGATEALRRVFGEARYDTKRYKKMILTDMNAICAPDARFTDIECQQLTDMVTGPFEVFLEEDGRELVRASHCGSGLKTVLIATILLRVFPEMDGNDSSEGQLRLANHAFGFEELENNIHPDMLRRFLHHVQRMAEEGAPYRGVLYAGLMRARRSS